MKTNQPHIHKESITDSLPVWHVFYANDTKHACFSTKYAALEFAKKVSQ